MTNIILAFHKFPGFVSLFISIKSVMGLMILGEKSVVELTAFGKGAIGSYLDLGTQEFVALTIWGKSMLWV